MTCLGRQHDPAVRPVCGAARLLRGTTARPGCCAACQDRAYPRWPISMPGSLTRACRDVRAGVGAWLFHRGEVAHVEPARAHAVLHALADPPVLRFTRSQKATASLGSKSGLAISSAWKRKSQTTVVRPAACCPHEALPCWSAPCRCAPCWSAPCRSAPCWSALQPYDREAAPGADVNAVQGQGRPVVPQVRQERGRPPPPGSCLRIGRPP
jgi:hypothetical protein